MDTNKEVAGGSQRIGWPVAPWCAAVGLSRAYLYTLSDDAKPESFKIGRRRVIVEQPGDWLRRIGQGASV